MLEESVVSKTGRCDKSMWPCGRSGSRRLDAPPTACRGVYAGVIRVLGLAGLLWDELAELQVGGRIAVPGPGFG